MLLKIKNIAKTSEVGEALLNSTLLLRIDEQIFDLAWSIFKKQDKPRFSFTDCITIAVCRVKGITKIATFDKEFQNLKEYTIIGPSV